MNFEWSAQQVLAFAWFAMLGTVKSLVIRARAGCGKTTTIVEGIKRYVAACREAGVTVRVLATAFNTKITKELTERLRGLMGVDVKGLNALGFYFVRQAVKRVRLDPDGIRKYDVARAVEPNGSNKLITLLANLHSKARELEPFAKCGKDLEDLADRFNFTIDEELSEDGWTQEGLCDAAYDCMVYASKNFQVIDFVDQIFLPLRNRWVFPVYDRVIVDETQDLSMPQLAMLQGACKSDGAFCIVGDDMQAIYGFRGADVTALDRLKTELEADEIALNVTRRCPKLIVKDAQELCQDFISADDAPEGTITRDRCVADMLDQVKPGDFILSRVNAPLASLCLKLLRNKIPAYVAGRNIGAQLAATVRRLKLDAIEDLAGKLSEYAAKRQDKVSKDKRAVNDEWLTARNEEISDECATIEAVADGCLTPSELLGRLADLFTDEGNGVMLSTAHKAKGLEADTVWICDGTFRIKSDEDKRVRYVAITRSKSTLHYVKGFEKKTTVDN